MFCIHIIGNSFRAALCWESFVVKPYLGIAIKAGFEKCEMYVSSRREQREGLDVVRRMFAIYQKKRKRNEKQAQ